MGVDYTATFGIGIEVKGVDYNEKGFDCMYEYLDDLLEGTNFEYGESGEGAYTGEENDFYILIKNPFENGIEGLAGKANELEVFLKDKNIPYDKINLVGGLHIW